MDPAELSLVILARILAVIGAAVGGVALALFLFWPSLVSDRLTTEAIGIIGLAAPGYYLSLHQWLKRIRLAISAFILCLISAAGLILLIAATGGLDSPYYALWLLAIVTAGLFGRWPALATLTATALYYSYDLWHNQFASVYVRAHLGQLLITVAAGVLAEWIHDRIRRGSFQTERAASLSGKLNEEQLKSQVLMSSIGEGVIVVDQNRRIQFFNPAAQTLSGWDEASAQNLDYNLVLNLRTTQNQPLDPATDPFKLSTAKGQGIVRNDLVMLTKSARTIPLSLSVSPIYDDNHQITGSIALMRDISQELEVERQRNEFISTASHEMRTPVAAIEGYLALALNPNVAIVDDRARGYLTKAHDNILHLGELFRDLLSVTKMDASIHLVVGEVNLTELTANVTSDLQFAAEKKGLKLSFTGSPGASGKTIAPLYFVKANTERLREVVTNLVDNAIKFTASGSVAVVIEGSRDVVTVKVSDTGPGIAAEDVPHLFQKFYRIDSSATRTIGGTGLGLFLCRSIIELYNGHIGVESVLGQGSTFSFSLPRIQPSTVTGPVVAAIPAAVPISTPPTPVLEPTPPPIAPPRPIPAQVGANVAAPIPVAPVASGRPVLSMTDLRPSTPAIATR